MAAEERATGGCGGSGCTALGNSDRWGLLWGQRATPCSLLLRGTVGVRGVSEYAISVRLKGKTF